VANVFLSYAGEDAEVARIVRGWLAADGHKVFEYQDPRAGVPLGEQWEQRIYERLRRADAMVCVVTTAYERSAWCNAEVGAARLRRIRLLPVLAERGATHPVLATTQHVDYTRDPEAARDALLHALRPESRWPAWLSRHTAVIAVAVTVVLGAAGLVLVLNRDTVDAATQRLRNADPCPLLDIEALEEFGDPEPITPQFLQSCRATVTSPGHETEVRVGFDPPAPRADLVSDTDTDQIQRIGAIFIVPEKQLELRTGQECTYRLWLAPDQPVVAVEAQSYDKIPIELCQVSHTAMMAAVGVLASGVGIEYVEDRTGKYSHAQHKACDLLDSTALSKVPGLGPNSAEPGYANWRCVWSGSGGRATVELELLLEKPNFTGYDEEDYRDIDGKAGYVSDNEEDCDADVVHRRSSDPDRATEMLRLAVKAPDKSPDELCALVTDLAIAAEQELSSFWRLTFWDE